MPFGARHRTTSSVQLHSANPGAGGRNCDIKAAVSSAVIWNMHSAGKRSALRRTCSFRRRVSTPYSTARSRVDDDLRETRV